MTRKLTIFALVIVFAASAQAGLFDRGVKGNGDIVTEVYDLDQCHAVLLECGLDIDISFGDRQRVELIMDENLVELFEFDVRRGVLTIDTEKSVRPSKKTKLNLVLVSLDDLEISGAGDIEIADFRGDKLALSIGGAGDLDVDGEVTDLEIDVNGAGDIDARQLHAQRADVSVNGAGDVDVYASDACEVSINGVGDVSVYGDPEHFEKSVNGIGDIKRK